MKAPVLVAFLLSVSSTALVAQDWSLHTPALKKSVFKLESNEGHCSSVLINEKDGYVISAAHCVPPKAEGRSVAVDEKHADVVRHNEVLDLVVVKVADLRGTALALRKEDTVPGLPVGVVGYGFAASKNLKFGFGWVSDVRDNSLRGVGDRLYFSAAGVVPGDSGGAVVDLSGRLVSIVQGGMCAGPMCVSFGAPTNTVEDFLKPFLPKNP